MATPIKQTPEARNSGRTSVCISRPAYNGASKHARAKTRKYSVPKYNLTIAKECSVVPNYLKPSSGSCHDKCKHGVKDDDPSPIKHKRSVFNRKKVARTVVERKNLTETKRNPLPPKRVVVSNRNPLVNRNESGNVVKTPKSLPARDTKPKQMGVGSLCLTGFNGRKTEKDVKSVKKTGVAPKEGNVEKTGLKANGKNRNRKLVSPSKDQNRMTKTKLKQLINKKNQTESETKRETAEFIQPLTNLTSESTNPPDSEISRGSSEEQVPKVESYTEEEQQQEQVQSSSEEQVPQVESYTNEEHVQSSCDKEVSEQERENTNDEDGSVSKEDNEMDGSNDDKGRMVNPEEDDDSVERKFRRGRVIEPEPEDNDLRLLKFRRGTILDDDSNEDAEKVTLKHSEVEKKEAQELLNSIIEETASKLAEDRKTKVGALVGAFETVISLQDEVIASE